MFNAPWYHSVWRYLKVRIIEHKTAIGVLPFCTPMKSSHYVIYIFSALQSCSNIDDHLRREWGSAAIPPLLQSKEQGWHLHCRRGQISSLRTRSPAAFDEQFKSHFMFNLSYDPDAHPCADTLSQYQCWNNNLNPWSLWTVSRTKSKWWIPWSHLYFSGLGYEQPVPGV